MANLPPMPRDPIGENHKWREWFNTVRNSIVGVAGSVPIIHNNLSSIQGGTSTERYHLTQTQLSGLTGAGNTGLHYHDTLYNVGVDSVQFSGGTGTQGTMSWNADEETVDLIQDGATLQLGQELQVHCRNNTGSTILNGTPVMATGTLGASGRITIAPMDGTIEAYYKYLIGITTEDIAAGTDGKVTVFGKVRGIDTSAWAEGTVLYISTSTVGAFQIVEPDVGIKMPVAFVISSHANVGTLMVRVTAINENAWDATGTAATLMDGHIADLDPHAQYVLDSEKAAANGVATLDTGGLVPEAQLPPVAIIGQVTTFTLPLTLITDWQDTGINGADLATGSYMVQLYANDTGSGGTNHNEYYTGMMSWYSGTTSISTELPTDEVVLHRAGGSGTTGLYLRTLRTSDPLANLKLQIYSNLANASSANYVFKFRQLM